ncbi:non-canonical purine NTP pyrophosphatase [Myxococcus sp. RHSTA-1-4]|uniref:non-canonical purine NTP pyrophosphatase n=1 Tax=Myxococcus sp. RHSTA-1-4 TaxID=2874601 RepID=UPI001CBEF9BA|nr:non-canonical purine NTP pyrophosphatase [Myxococcus sp. RHSTA-1-4]MBZ4418597.1 non-canonical purine NTP pyrophosphatase [Myxococcus sp. RHSTA-1-4]
MKTAYYYTSNDYKAAEARHVFEPAGKVGVLKVRNGITEILDVDLDRVIRAKAAAAYAAVRYPVVVEHGAFCIDFLQGLPGALVRPFWEKLGARLCGLVPPGQPRTVRALSAVCYCDGKRREVIIREVRGELATDVRGSGGYHWDPVFIPESDKARRTFAEMPPEEKLRLSPAGLAYAAMRDWMEKNLGGA